MKNKPALFLLFALTSALPVTAASTWYVDVDNDGGTETGVAWATAWGKLTDIVWGSIDPGDTIYISGGTYNDGVWLIGANGSEGSPITIKKSQEVGHDDHITFNGRISSGAAWVTFDGSIADGQELVYTNTLQVFDIADNIGWTIDSTDVAEHAVNLFGSGPTGVQFLWLDVTTGTDYSLFKKSHAFRVNAGDITDTVIAYCWIHDTTADGIGQSQDDDWAADSIVIHHNLVENIGDDGIVHNGGANIHHNIVINTLEISGHPDGIVGMGHNVSIWNNIVYDWNTQPLYPGISQQVASNLFIYGNLVYGEDLAESQETAILLTAEASLHAEGDPWTNSIWHNVIVANNTFVAGTWVQDPLNVVNRYSPINQSPEDGLVITNQNWIVKNNIMYQGNSIGADFKGTANLGSIYAGTTEIDNNVFYADAAPGLKVRYGQATYYTDAEAFNTGSGFTGNTSDEPMFVDAALFNFRLSSEDTVATGTGQNLSSLNLEGIEYDIYGNYRGAGAWNIGATADDAVDDTGPILLLSFEDDFVSNAFADDTSGNSADMLQYGWTGGDTTTNFPTATTGTIGSQAAAFVPYYDSHPYTDEDFFDGQYGAITNAESLNNLTNATFAAWVKFADVGTVRTGNFDHNATIMNAGYSTQGAWHWGRYYSTTVGEPQFNIQTNVAGGANATWRNKWPQPGPDDYYYTNNVWMHFAATIACGSGGTNLTVKLYTDGLPVVTNTIVLLEANKITDLAIHDPAGAANAPWIAVGCWTHNGNHELIDTGTPNNGWLNGSLDDVRIYSRVLTDSEVYALSGVSADSAIGSGQRVLSGSIGGGFFGF